MVAISSDLPGRGRKPTIDAAEIVRMTTQTKPAGATHWSTRKLVAQLGISDTSVLNRSVPELIAAIEEYIVVHNQNPKPFVWTAKANDILQKVIRANRKLGSKKNEALHYRGFMHTIYVSQNGARRTTGCFIHRLLPPVWLWQNCRRPKGVFSANVKYTI